MGLGTQAVILTAHQSKYLPWLGLFHKIALSTHYVSFDMVQYQKKEFLNRNYIKGPDGTASRLTVPVLSAGLFDQFIEHTEIDNRMPWARKHWRSLLLSYKSAPYFARFAGFFEATYEREWQFLVDLNRHILEFLLAELGISVVHRKAADLGFSGKGSDLVLDMCRKMGASAYIFGEGGLDYAETEAFAQVGVGVFFQTYTHPVYPQLHGDFISGLSVIDLLFNCGPGSLETIMSGNTAAAVCRAQLGLPSGDTPALTLDTGVAV